MKRIKIGKRIEIETPWLTGEEARQYCAMGRDSFYERARATHLPCTILSATCRKYHAGVLDAWMTAQPWARPE